MSLVEYSSSLFNYAFGEPVITGVIRSCPEDFQVDEELGFEPDGEGEHHLLQIRKRNTNTEWLARQLAKFVEIKPMDVSFAGLKDRNAVTTQWFSVRIPGLDSPDWANFNTDDYQIIRAERHGRKLRRGSLKGNSFTIKVRDCIGDMQTVDERLQVIKLQGVPNYFGEQRFGHHGDNLTMANMMLTEGKKIKNRQKRSIYISAARSYLFNLVCSARVAAGTWHDAIEGDVFVLTGSHSFFVPEKIDDQILKRVADNDIAPSGPLWGRGELTTTSEARALEEDVLKTYIEWCKGLEQLGLKQERRSLWLPVDGLKWNISEQGIELRFTLPAGSYATSVLRELIAS
jgi:tRNA pseudouridine13 synthase